MYLPLVSVKFIKFSLFGCVIFVISLIFNLTLVEFFLFKKSIAYIFVIVFQIFVNFYVNRYLIFEKSTLSISNIFYRYLILVFSFRSADWILYNIEVKFFMIPYPIAQTINTVLIFFSKYCSYKLLFEYRNKPTHEQKSI